MNPLASAILITWRRNGAYAARMIADLTSEQWLAQPVTNHPMNHPAWILSHLNVYTPIVTAMLRGIPFQDPIDHPHGQRSQVTSNPHDYADPAQLASLYTDLHTRAEHALATAPESRFGEPCPLERWRKLHPTIGDMLVTLMIKHESGHLGQLSAWRRAMGLPRTDM